MSQFFNVICRKKDIAGKQILVGQDRVLARRVANEESANLRKGESVTLWAIDHKTNQQTEMVCYGQPNGKDDG